MFRSLFTDPVSRLLFSFTLSCSQESSELYFSFSVNFFFPLTGHTKSQQLPQSLWKWDPGNHIFWGPTCAAPATGPMGKKHVRQEPRNRGTDHQPALGWALTCLRMHREDFWAGGDMAGPLGDRKVSLSFDRYFCVPTTLLRQKRPTSPCPG